MWLGNIIVQIRFEFLCKLELSQVFHFRRLIRKYQLLTARAIMVIVYNVSTGSLQLMDILNFCRLKSIDKNPPTGAIDLLDDLYL